MLVGYAEALGGAKAAATPGGGDIDPNQELVLGQLPGTEAYRYVGRHPEAVTCPGLLIWRVGGDLFFASIGHFEEGLAATA